MLYQILRSPNFLWMIENKFGAILSSKKPPKQKAFKAIKSKVKDFLMRLMTTRMLLSLMTWRLMRESTSISFSLTCASQTLRNTVSGFSLKNWALRGE